MILSSVLFLALGGPAALVSAACVSKNCKAFPGSPDWPSKKDWSGFNETLDGRLIKPVAPGGVCHDGQPNYEPDQCPNVAEQWFVPQFHANDPVSVMWDNWANFTCLPNPDYPCSVGGYPSYVVNVTTAEHVKTAIDFGRHPTDFMPALES